MKNKYYLVGIEIKVINLMLFDIDDINLLIGVYFVRYNDKIVIYGK